MGQLVDYSLIYLTTIDASLLWKPLIYLLTIHLLCFGVSYDSRITQIWPTVLATMGYSNLREQETPQEGLVQGQSRVWGQISLSVNPSPHDH
ncbi:MAG: hypothetical protein L0H53_15490 [Candidatus Nitrosocosmicus sp.]|nr:hypothetical protein [Candidatus Nitrosocosmicus sp.]MDN5867263.1 hypothetical protein [Candidatus Nitrosocosmicus sp.]